MNIRKTVFVAVILASFAFVVSCAGASAGSDSKDEGTTAGSIDLASLSVTPGTLVPAFDKNVTEYTVNVENTVKAVKVEATTVDKFAGRGISPFDVVNKNTPLTDEPTIIAVTVTAADLDFSKPDPAKIKRYYVTVTRASK